MPQESATPTNPPAPAAATVGQRLTSVDALRGFDMFWIIGANSLVMALNSMASSGILKGVANQLTHKEWEGFAFYDLIFPLFVFITGVSLVFSLTKTIATEGRPAALKRVVRRGLLLLIVGIFYSGGFANDWPNMRMLGVLNRIGLAYMFAGLIFCFCKWRGLATACAGILLGYWAMMEFVPIRDIRLEKGAMAELAKTAGTTNAAVLFQNTTAMTRGHYEPGRNLANHIDFQFLPGKLYDTYYDPEGLLSTLPAIGTCLLGALCGLLLQNKSLPEMKKVGWLVLGGALAVALGFLWGTKFPVVKKLWTSSFVLVAGGYSAMLLGVFYLVVDVWKHQKWCQPFIWIGMNALTVYLAANIVNFRKLAQRFTGGDVQTYLNTHVAQGFGTLVWALTGLMIGILLCRFLYRRKIFLRL